MRRTVAIGEQDFCEIICRGYFYIDKTDFIQEWWENGDSVTLIARPRRFGKTITMNMLNCFFSNKYAGRGDLFEGLAIWKEEKYRRLQGTYPVIFLSFASVKRSRFQETFYDIKKIISREYRRYAFIIDSSCFSEIDKKQYHRILTGDYDNSEVNFLINQLSEYLYDYYGKKVIILLDEYDTPMQEAYVNGYWDEMSEFIRGLFNSTFKTNPYMERAIMTGITRVSKESVFSDLNNLEVVTTTSQKYETAFGFTEKEVFEALGEYGLAGSREDVKYWYDGFRFGECASIYNPWSITNFLEKKKFLSYWANTSSNQLVKKLIQQSSPAVKTDFEDLLQGKSIQTAIDEQIAFSDLDDKNSGNKNAIYSFLLASGYLKIKECVVVAPDWGDEGVEYKVSLTNMEINAIFQKMVHEWFSDKECGYNDFLTALLNNDLKSMNRFMNQVALSVISYFDSGSGKSQKANPERFYHGFVLGLIVDLRKQFVVVSNRESGYGRYDVLIKPLSQAGHAMILEFKVIDPESEGDLQDTANAALRQIMDQKYAAGLESEGISQDRIWIYGFAFKGKDVLIDGGRLDEL